MDTNRIQQRLNVETSKQSSNTDTYLKINLDGKEKLLPPDEINRVVNIGERFNIERQRSPFYRIVGTINPVISNVLFNLNDNIFNDLYTWAGFNFQESSAPFDYRFLDRSYPKDQNLSDDNDLNYKQSISNFLKEVDGWFGYYEPDITKKGLCNYFDMEPKRERFSLTPDISPYNCMGCQPVKNWELTITYPKYTDKNHTMVKGGLFILDYVPVVVSTRNMVAFGLPVRHNLIIGDIVRLSGTTGYDGDHLVVRTGLDDGSLKEYYFVIDSPPTSGPSPINPTSKMKRIVAGMESEYYFRIFDKIKTRSSLVIEQDDYEVYNLAFSENIYADTIYQYVFNEDIDISGLTDNLGRPLSEIYLTYIKTNSNGVFTNVSSGIETPFISELNNSGYTYLVNIPAINKIHNGGVLPFPSHIPLESNVTISGNVFYGDVVEYNIHEVKETVLADVYHRFNTVNRETTSPLSYVSSTGTSPAKTNIDLGPRQEGYFYKAHNIFKIREYSTYIEQGDSSTEGIPDYAVNLGDGRYLWRDFLDIGYNENSEEPLDYPFLNGCHYLYDNHCFHVRRQDPFGNWLLYYANFPSDPIGEVMTNKFTIKSSENNVC